MNLQMTTFTTEIFRMPQTTVTNNASFDIQKVPRHKAGREIRPYFPTLQGSKLTLSVAKANIAATF